MTRYFRMTIDGSHVPIVSRRISDVEIHTHKTNPTNKRSHQRIKRIFGELLGETHGECVMNVYDEEDMVYIRQPCVYDSNKRSKSEK